MLAVGCDYVLHSTGQLYSHKRKHERRDFEVAYKSFKTQQHPIKIKPIPLHQPIKLAPATSQPIRLAPSTSQQSAVVRHSRVLSSEEFIDIEDLAAINQSGSLNESDSSSLRTLSTVMDLSLPGTPGNPLDMTESSKIFSGTSQSEESCSPVQGSSHCSTMEQLGSTLKGDVLGDSLNLSIPSYDDDKHTPVEEGVHATSEGSSPTCDSAASQSGARDAALSTSVPLVNDRKEKNDLWKKYLTRYTANDPCVARCELLYKDHYHCSVTRCGMLFRSKDGVHEHAKCHEQQERITALCYMTYDSNTSCDPSCPYNHRQVHFHCLWAGCMQVLTEDDPVFSRLEHQKVHEYARGVVSRRIFPSTPRVPADAMRRRRGRPPKYPHRLIPIVPKMEMSEEEIQRLVLSLWNDTGARLVVSCGFKQFDPDNACPDSKCMFVAEKQHYHCVRQRCYYATNRRDMLNLHARDFHSFINILDGFEFFDRSVDCRRVHCHHNHVRRHFHCVRPRCDYSFVRYSTMIQHDKKHKMANERYASLQSKSVVGVNGLLSAAVPQISAVSSVPKIAPTNILGTMTQQSLKPQAIRPLIPLIAPRRAAQPHSLSHTPGGTTAVAITNVAPIVIQSVSSSPITLSTSVVNVSSNVAGGVIPVTSVSTMKDVTSVPLSTVSSTLLMINNPLLSSSSSNLVTIAPKPSTASTLPLTVLLQQQQLQQQQQKGESVMSPQLSWLTLKMNMHYGMHQNCGRPFCKLKKKDHYHCSECNQAFSNPIRLKMHIAKHRIKTTSNTTQCDAAPIDGAPDASSSNDTNYELSSSLNLSMTTFANLLNKEQPNSLDDDNDDSDGLVIDLSLPISECGDSCSTTANLDDDKDDDMLDISQVERQLEMTEEHNIAMPTKMQSISTGRRQDGVPEGYVRFRHVEDCSYAHCTYRHTVTHYHCARPTCGHAFSDRARTQQHTKRHGRTDAIMADDFEHFRIHIDCQRTDCEHTRVTSHYHCRRCLFICTDTAKVIAHRKHHLRLKKVEVQGYRKFTKREACNFETCSYSGKQCHYHCLEEGCSQTMLGSAQMAAHKNRHRDGSLCKDKYNGTSLAST